jgi:N-acyl-phosphatidylethanolamine-hydrolysing phospholipase D
MPPRGRPVVVRECVRNPDVIPMSLLIPMSPLHSQPPGVQPHATVARRLAPLMRLRVVLGTIGAFAVAVVLGIVGGCVGPHHVTEPSASGLPGDAEVRSHPWYSRAHHAEGRFQNVYRALPQPSVVRVAAWVLTHRVLARPFGLRDDRPTPSVAVDSSALGPRPDGLRATWIGHATLYVQTPELDLLLDPVFSRVAGPVSFAGPDRRAPLPLNVDDLPGVDVVLISHDHYDHLDGASIRRLVERFDPVFLVPLGVGQYVRRWGGRRVAELDWWQYVDLPGATTGAGVQASFRFTCTPAEHNSGRQIGAFDRTLWAGWHVERRRGEKAGDGPTLFYAGDTGYGSHFEAVRVRLGAPDVAVLPIGAYAPRSITAPFHVTPEEAVQAFIDLGGATPSVPGRPRALVPVHWGTFELTDEPLHEPPLRLGMAADRAELHDHIQFLPVGGHFAWTTNKLVYDLVP